MKRRIVVVGAGYGGTACAVRLARKSPEDEVVLVNSVPYFVERIRLHEDVAGPSLRPRIPLESHVGDRVRVVVGWVEGIDLDARRVHVGGRAEAFDELVIATGSSAAPPSHTVAVTTEEQMLVARARLSATGVKRVVVVGAGLTGTEAASELAHRRPDLAITLVSSGDLVPGSRPFFDRHGVEVIEHQRVAAFERDGVILESGAALESDVTVWAGGFVASRLAAEYVPAVDDRLRSTTHPFVRVVGDAASGHGLEMRCAVAIPTGCYVADDLAGCEDQPFSWRWVVNCISLGRKEGIVQLDARRIGGRPAAWIKEFICRFALASTNEGWGFEYRWPHERRHETVRGGTLASLRDRVPDAR
jgi:NADH:ubiquinone reductase (H+-translocating)